MSTKTTKADLEVKLEEAGEYIFAATAMIRAGFPARALHLLEDYLRTDVWRIQ